MLTVTANDELPDRRAKSGVSEISFLFFPPSMFYNVFLDIEQFNESVLPRRTVASLLATALDYWAGNGK